MIVPRMVSNQLFVCQMKNFRNVHTGTEAGAADGGQGAPHQGRAGGQQQEEQDGYGGGVGG